jgi:hypothetical protein
MEEIQPMRDYTCSPNRLATETSPFRAKRWVEIRVGTRKSPDLFASEAHHEVMEESSEVHSL